MEKYHASLHKVYNIITINSPANTNPTLTLQTAIQAYNNNVGPDSLIFTLLIFGIIPRRGLLNNLLTPATYKRAAIIRKAIEKFTRANTKKQVSEALKARNGLI